MEGISKQYLKNSLISITDAPIDDVIKSAFAILTEKLITECRELQEPWMTLDEFLKSGFEGLCWVFTEDSKAIVLEFIGDGFFDVADNFRMHHKTITHVMPIHKPEPPVK